jgi:hypothetical protein
MFFPESHVKIWLYAKPTDMLMDLPSTRQRRRIFITVSMHNTCQIPRAKARVYTKQGGQLSTPINIL